MTNFEAISADLYPYSVDANLIIKACIDSGVDNEARYTANSKRSVVMATIAILRNLIVLSGESNGGYSLSYDVAGLKTRIRTIAKANDLPDIADEFNTSPSIEFLPV